MSHLLRLLVASLSLLFVSFGSASEAPFPGPNEISSLLIELQPLSHVPSRIEAASRSFLGRPFSESPLGEGPTGRYDNDPLARTDAFDCTTYVETVLALALASDPFDFLQTLGRIRYRGGDVGFLTRNHFPETDWIPNGLKAGFFRDVTSAIGEGWTAHARTTIKKSAWYGKFDEKRLNRADLSLAELSTLLVELREETKSFTDESAELDYLPLRAILRFSEAELMEREVSEAVFRDFFAADEAKLRKVLARYRRHFLHTHRNRINRRLLDRIPSGSLVSFVHPEAPLEASIGTNMLVTHQGILVRTGREVFLRHAAFRGQVTELPLVEYLNTYVIPGPLDPRGIHLLEASFP